MLSAGQRWRLLAGGLLAGLLLFVFFRGIDWASLGHALRQARPGYLAGVVAATVVVYLARAWRWGYLLAPLSRVPYSHLVSATLVGFMSGLLVPRAGEIVRPYLVARRQGIRIPAALASIILERLFDLLTVLVLFALYLYVLPAPAAQRPGALLDLLRRGGILVGAAALVLLAVLLAFHVHAGRAMGFIDRLLRHLPAWLCSRLSHALRAFSGGLAVLQAPGPHLLAIAFQSLVVWLAIALGIDWTNRAFGLELPFHAAFLLIAFLVVGVSIPTPGFVGGFHQFYLLALTEVFGVDKVTAAAAAIACHALSSLPVLVLGLALLGREGLSLGKVAEMAGREELPAGRELGVVKE